MDKRFLTIMGSVVIAWTLATTSDFKLIGQADRMLLNLVTTMPEDVNVPVGRFVTVL